MLVYLLQDGISNEDYFFCEVCADYIRNAFDYKVLCLNTEDSLIPYYDAGINRDIDLRKIVQTECDDADKISDDQTVCRLCKHVVVKTSVIPLATIMNRNMLDIFHNHIPEMVSNSDVNSRWLAYIISEYTHMYRNYC